MPTHDESYLETCLECALECERYLDGLAWQLGEPGIATEHFLLRDCANLCYYVAASLTTNRDLETELSTACSHLGELCARHCDKDILHRDLSQSCSTACRRLAEAFAGKQRVLRTAAGISLSYGKITV